MRKFFAVLLIGCAMSLGCGEQPKVIPPNQTQPLQPVNDPAANVAPTESGGTEDAAVAGDAATASDGGEVVTAGEVVTPIETGAAAPTEGTPAPAPAPAAAPAGDPATPPAGN